MTRITFRVQVIRPNVAILTMEEKGDTIKLRFGVSVNEAWIDAQRLAAKFAAIESRNHQPATVTVSRYPNGFGTVTVEAQP